MSLLPKPRLTLAFAGSHLSGYLDEDRAASIVAAQDAGQGHQLRFGGPTRRILNSETFTGDFASQLFRVLAAIRGWLTTNSYRYKRTRAPHWKGVRSGRAGNVNVSAKRFPYRSFSLLCSGDPSC